MAFSHGSLAKLFLNGADVSGYFDDAQLSGDIDQAEATVFGDTVKSFISGQEGATFSLTGKFDGDVGAIDEQISALLGPSVGDVIFSLLPAGDGFGKNALGIKGPLTKYEVHAPVKDIVSTSVEAMSNTGHEGSKVLKPMATESASNNGADLDNGASSANGGVAYLHVEALTGTPNAVIKVQHSTDGITWVDLITFDNVTTAPQAQRKTVAGTVNRHVRAILSSIGGSSSVTYNVSFGRK